MKRILLSFCLLAFVALNVVFSQGKLNVDSLAKVAENYPKDDTTQINRWLEIAFFYSTTNPAKGLESIEKAISIAKKINQPLFEARSYYQKGNCFLYLGELKQAIDIYNQAASIYEEIGKKSGFATCLLNIGSAYLYLQECNESIKYYEKAKLIFEKLGDKATVASCFNGLGASYMTMNNHVKGIEYGEKALKIAQELNDKVEIVSSLNSLGIAYSKISDYPKSLDYFQKALAANENLENSDYILSLYTNISIIYYNLQDYNKALDYDNKAIKLAEQIGNKQVIAKLFFNKSSRFSALNQYEQALELDKKGLYYAEELNDSSYMLVGLSHLIHDYSVLKNYSQALYYGKRALELSTKFVEHETSSAIFGDLGDIYLNASEDILKSFGINPSDRYSKVEEAYQDAIIAAHKINDKVSLQSALKSASSFYEKKGNYIKAYELFKEHITIKDSISGDDVKKQITRKEIQYEFDKKEAALKYEQQLTANELEKQRLLTFQQGQTLTLKEQALALSNKEKDLAHLAFLKEKAEKQEKEQALLLAQKDKDLTGVQLLNLAKEKALQLQEIARKNATIGFLGASMLAILLAAALFYLWLKKRQAQTEATRQAELQAAFTQQLFAETESERARIARDLHDGISHELLGLKRTSLPANSDAAQKIDGVIESIRQISRNLHPVMLDSIGLQLSIESFCEQFAEAHNLFVNYEINYSNELHKNTELQVLRIIQEALTNTAKHANAQAANVSLSNYGNGVLLKIQDNGKGFEVEKALNSGKAFGLQSIIERAKIIHTKANIYSTPQGTIIELKIS